MSQSESQGRKRLAGGQNVLFENGEAAFARSGRRAEDPSQRKLAALEAKVQQKNEVIAELMQEHVELKKEVHPTKAYVVSWIPRILSMRNSGSRNP